MSGHKKNSKPPKEKIPLSHGWIVLPSKTYPDRVYFYNTVTKCSTWDNPCKATKGRRYNSSSETSSSEDKRLTKLKCPQTSHHKKEKSKTVLNSPNGSICIQINNEIEDYDEQQDQYFDNVSVNGCSSSLSNIISPPSSPCSITSSRTSISDFDKDLDSSILLEDNKSQLWGCCASSPDNPSAKKSVTLSDFGEPSTSVDFKMDKISESPKKKSSLKGFLEGSKETYFKNITENPEKKAPKTKKKKKSRINLTGKTFKNVSFKKCDKTPAQTRLLKLRKQNAERLKKLADNNPDFVILNKKVVDVDSKIKNNNLSLDDQTANESFSDAYFKRIEICNNVVQKTGNYSEVDFDEEIDWEPSTEESDVKNIHTFCEHSDKAMEVSNNIFLSLNSDHSLMLSVKANLFLVLDTNIFVSCLGFVKDLRDTTVPGLGYPVIYVPWRVLQELDHLKDSKIDAVDRHLHMNVRKAIAFLNENFKFRHPRILGQSFEDFANMVDVETSAPDNEILQTCIQFQKQHADKKLILLTNDKNLESKAIVSGVEVYSKERFHKKYLNSNVVSHTFSNDLNTLTLNTLTNGSVKIDTYLCEIQAVLKEFLTLFVETEMKIAFEDDWIKMAFKKPPWTLEDALQCLLKHWRSVFFLNFTKEARFEAEKLNERLFKKVPATTEDIVEIIRIVQQLILSIGKSQKKKMPYTDLVPTTLTKLSGLLKACLSDNSPEADSSISTAIPSSFSTCHDSYTQQVSQNEVFSGDISKVKSLFKDIWDSLRNFCCSISEVINSPEARNNIIVQEMKLKMSQILKEVEDLVVTTEKILELNISDVNEHHPLIIYFSNFLIRVHSGITPDLIHELPRCLAAFFVNFEVRSLLSSFLKDFKDFIQNLFQAAEYFNVHFPS